MTAPFSNGIIMYKNNVFRANLNSEVNKMKKIVAGGFLSLVGSIWALAILVSASNSLVNEWVTETGRLMSTVIEMKMMFPLILCVICIAFGIIMMLVESFRRDK